MLGCICCSGLSCHQPLAWENDLPLLGRIIGPTLSSKQYACFRLLIIPTVQQQQPLPLPLLLLPLLLLPRATSLHPTLSHHTTHLIFINDVSFTFLVIPTVQLLLLHPVTNIDVPQSC